MATRGYKVLDSKDVEQFRDSSHDFALDVLTGLKSEPKTLSSKYFYDDAGSDLFRKIMALDEYYPTDCEREVLTKHASEICQEMLKKKFNLVDLGAGDGAKTVVLLKELERIGADVVYVPVDISEGAMKTLVDTVGKDCPDIPISGLVCEYGDALGWLGSAPEKRQNLVLFLGSNLGNFTKPLAKGFLRRLWNSLAHDDLVLIGFDMKKDIDVLLSAYNDREGVTAEFNLNLLSRINRELGGDFDVAKFRHFGTYDVFLGAMKSYLVSLESQTVRIEKLACEFEFKAWEPIHTEYSYKYLPEDVEELARETGYEVQREFADGRNWFVDAVWRVQKEL